MIATKPIKGSLLTFDTIDRAGIFNVQEEVQAA